MGDSDSTKNATRLAKLLGTWTIETNFKTSVVTCEVKSHFIIHLSCDTQLKGNSCSLDGCNEIDNKVCMLEKAGPACKSMEGTTVDWSDAVAFIYFGASVDAGKPFNKHVKRSTGGWVGPLNIILAQNQTASLGERRDDVNVVDSYIVKFVYSPTTPFIKEPKDCDILEQEDYTNYMGPGAINHTVYAQANANYADADCDPYEKYLKTCDNGDVQPVFPYVQFDFIQDSNDPTKEEKTSIRLKYKLLSIPTPDLLMYHIFPKLMKHGLPISGPYCYGDDPHRGYTIDLSYDDAQPNKFSKLHHVCVEGLPCIPPAIEDCNCTHESNAVIPDTPDAPSEPTVINVGNVIGFSIAVTVLGLMLIFSIYMNYKQWKRQSRRQTAEENENYFEFEQKHSTNIENENYFEIGHKGIEKEPENMLTQALLQERQEDSM